jgi:hypothetical protein
MLGESDGKACLYLHLENALSMHLQATDTFKSISVEPDLHLLDTCLDMTLMSSVIQLQSVHSFAFSS